MKNLSLEMNNPTIKVVEINKPLLKSLEKSEIKIKTPPLKVLETAPTKISLQTKLSWAICLNANTNDKLGHYYLENNSLNQRKISKVISTFPFSLLPDQPTILKLRDYQAQDIQFLDRLKSAAIFSEMRTGKTPIALKTFQNWPVTNLLIIVPSVLQKYWQEQVQSWLNQPAYIITYLEKEWRIYFYQKLVKEKDWIVIVSKDTFKLDNDYWEKVKKPKQDYCIIIDEVHFLRNHKTQQSKSIFILKAPYKLVLTGTPTVNHQSDIFGILKFLQPEKYKSYWKFVQDYFKIEKYKISYEKYGRERFFFRWEVKDFKNNKKREELQDIVWQFSVNRRQKEILPWLPKIIYRTEKLLMNEEQQKAYRELEEHWRKYQPLDILADLKTLTLYPPLKDCKTLGCKIEFLIDFCSEWQDKKEALIIFSTRSETFLEPLAKILEEKKIKIELIIGNLNHAKKEEVIKRFQEGRVNILLANLQCVSLGLNLSRAETIIFADRSYSPADNDQAEARFLPVEKETNPRVRMVIDLVCQKTIDEKVLKLLKRKENLIKVLNEGAERIFDN